MGLYKVTNQSALVILILLPFCLYILSFGNIAGIPALEVLAFRFLRAGETFFATHQRLVIALLRLTPLRISRTTPIGLGPYYDGILGAIFFGFTFSMLWQFNFSPRISYGSEVFIVAFSIGIPPIKYALIYALYAVHSFASLVPSCRARFLANGDFDDPYLCAIYFGRTPWRDLYRHIRGERTQGTCACVARALFSKTSAAFYFTTASVAFLVTQRALLSAGRVFGFVALVFFLAIPLCSTVSFPSFILAAFRSPHATDNEVRREFAAVAVADCPRDVFGRYVSYARRHWALRSIVLLGTGVITLFAVFAFYVALNPAGAAKWQPVPMPMPTAHAHALADERHRVTHAICDASVKTLSIFQIGVLEQLSEVAPFSADFNATLALMADIFGWQNLSALKIVTTPFPDKKLGSQLQHFILEDRGLHVFAICGSKNILDLLVDLELWATGVLWSLFRAYVPLLAAFNHIGRPYMAKLMALPRAVFRPLSIADDYVTRIEAYIRSVRIADDEDVLITGHSLGGGVAKVLAFATGHATVAWSGPGHSQLEGVYGRFEARPHIVSITPEQDWVATIDPSEGTTFRLPCTAGAMYCHDLRRMLCQMGVMCGTFELVRPRCEVWFTQEMIDDMFEVATPHYTN
jgi:lipase ATG15